MRYGLVALRYVVTGIVAPLLALLLVLLLVELGAAIDAALGHVQKDAPASGNFGGSVTAQARKLKRFLWRAGVEVSFVFDQADFQLATLYSGATTRSAQPSASLVVRF